MNSPHSLVSIILPTFNRAHILPRAIDSVLRQTYADWELIVIDDGSTDGTESLIDQYRILHPNIIYVKRPNQGPSASRNVGLEIARGVLTTYLDSDDAYEPQHVALRVAFLHEHPEVRFLHGGFRVIGEEDRLFVPDKDDPANLISIYDCIIGGTFFGYTEVFQSAGGWRGGYSEDSEFFGRITEKFAAVKVNFPTYLYYRDQTDSRCELTRM